MRKIENRKIKDESEKLRKLPTAQTGMSSIAQASKPQNHGGNKIRASSAPDGRGRQGEAPPVVDYNSVTPERWQSGRMRRFAKPLYGLTPVPRVRIPPSPPDSLSCRESPSQLPTQFANSAHYSRFLPAKSDCRERTAMGFCALPSALFSG